MEKQQQQQLIYELAKIIFHDFFLVFFKNKIEFFYWDKEMLLKHCSSIKRKQDIFCEKNRGFVDLEFMKMCHEQVKIDMTPKYRDTKAQNFFN